MWQCLYVKKIVTQGVDIGHCVVLGDFEGG